MVSIRAMCLAACGCHLGKVGVTGLFGTVDQGCPQACTGWATTIDQWWHRSCAHYYDYSDADAANSQGACQDALDMFW